MKTGIEQLRDQIDSIDEAIAAAVGVRRIVVGAMRAEKERLGIAFEDPEREAAIEAKYATLIEDASPEKVKALVRAVLEASR